MPKYMNTGGLAEKVQPKLYGQETYPPISDEAAFEWWQCLTEGIEKDPTLNVEIMPGENLYYYDDRGTMVPAYHADANTYDPEFIRDLMLKSLDGRLFTRSFGQSDPKQVITKNDKSLDITVSPNGTYGLSTPEPVAPKRPNFFKYLLSPFVSSFKKEISQYNEKQAEYQNQVRQNEWVKKLTAETYGGAFLKADFTKDEAKSDYFTRSAAVSEAGSDNLARSVETLLHPQEEVTLEESPLTDFESYVKDMAGQQKSWADMSIEELSADETFTKLLDPKNEPTLSTLYSALDAQLQSNMAKGLLATANSKATPAEKEAFLKAHQPFFRAAAEGIREVIPDLASDELKMGFIFALTGDAEAITKLTAQVHEFAKTGLDKYAELIRKQNAAAREQQPQQPAPQAQVQNDAPKKEQSLGAHTI